MSDNLKKHIEKNRQDYEVFKVDYDDLWAGIEKKLDEKTRHVFPWNNVLKIAASILLIMTLSVGFLWIKGNTIRYADGVSLADLSPELAEAEVYYNQLVNAKLEMIRVSNATIDPAVIADFNLLDSAYQELKVDLEDNMFNEEVIDAMIQNYRIKLQMLEMILKDIKKTNGDEDEDEEAISI